ncbi:Phosphatidylinositol N-acetylglucosaminyltransferase gpi3 subunit [Chytridiales sp. JEL 0842]|nr:Phosphatidylinositol N-acetylglucosaminyltransferase gpi3 subunit [Chytridiales sp. JEL 0842]
MNEPNATLPRLSTTLDDDALSSKKSLNICMVSDFFYPNFGGVESHLHFLSAELVRRGHKVIILTHAYTDRVGVRYLTTGVKVYHVPHWLVYDQVSFPTLYGFLPLFRYIVIREEIDVVHGHQAFSSMCHDAILNAKTLGLPACFTDHSLLGFDNVGSILINKLLKFTLSDVDHVICVSHTSKENTVLRAALNPRSVSVIPNAVIAENFTPNPAARDPSKITIVVMSRLVYRKGTDLLVAVIPRICKLFPDVQFLIAGDGPKRVELEQMREKHVLQDRVTVLGAVNHADVREVLVQGHIFLNTSLTEAFCIAIVEAACCGLLVVSTKVGGVPEVLPDHMIFFAEPEEHALVKSLASAVHRIKTDPIDSHQFHREIKSMYSWADVAERTEKVYHRVIGRPPLTLADRLLKYDHVGLWAGKFGMMIIAVSSMLSYLLEWLVPASSIERAPKVDMHRFRRACSERIALVQQEEEDEIASQ